MKMAYYLDGRTGIPVPPKVMQATYRDIWSKIEAQNWHSLVDVGCGAGLFIKKYAPCVKNIIGTDASVHMIKAAQKNNPQNLFFVCEAGRLPFPDQQFDRLLCYGVFHYLPDKKMAEQTIDEFRRVVKNDGLILIGDVLESLNPAPRSSVSKKNIPWWPSQLNHQLTKLKIPRTFFLDYCREQNYVCEILEQNIPGRVLPDTRYDIRIRLKK